MLCGRPINPVVMSGIPDGQSSLVVTLLGLVLFLVEGCVYTLKHPHSTLLTHPHTTPTTDHTDYM